MKCQITLKGEADSIIARCLQKLLDKTDLICRITQDLSTSREGTIRVQSFIQRFWRSRLKKPKHQRGGPIMQTITCLQQPLVVAMPMLEKLPSKINTLITNFVECYYNFLYQFVKCFVFAGLVKLSFVNDIQRINFFYNQEYILYLQRNGSG